MGVRVYYYFPHVQDLGDAYLADAWGTLLTLEFAVVAAAAAAAAACMDLIAADRVVVAEEEEVGLLSEIYFCYSESWGFARGFAAVVVAAAVHMEVIAADRVVVEDETGHPFDVYSCHYLTS